MRVIGFNFEKISAERKKYFEGNLEIKSNISVKDIKTEKIDIVKDQEALKFDFEFEVDYSKDSASVFLKGFALILIEKDRAKDILKKWKNKKIEEDVRLPLFNLILSKSNLRAMQLEEELGLPLHIPLPRVKPQSQEANYTG